MNIYRDLDPSQLINHQLMFYERHGKMFYARALKGITDFHQKFTTDTRDQILRNFVNSIVLQNTVKKPDLFDEWSQSFGYETDQFIELLFSRTELVEGFGYDKSIGILPDIWPYVENRSDLKEVVMDKLSAAVSTIEDASPSERQFFMEDLYLLEEEILAFIEQSQKWTNVRTVLEEFEPETPPKNQIESLRAQMEENARMLEQKNNKG